MPGWFWPWRGWLSPGERRRLSPGPPIRQDPAGPGPDELVLTDAGSRRRSMLSGGLPVPRARRRCLSSFREPRVSTCFGDQAAG
ncbi:Hypothetical protein RMP42_05689 [Roseomonas mucosa]|nr:Hypothetical protein RMP42_05689 [Roseomonas mucosa]